MINKNEYFLFVVWLIIFFAIADKAWSQSTKNVSKSGSFHEYLIIQEGDQQSVDLRQDGEWHRAFIFQAGFGQAANVNQSGGSNLVFIRQRLNVMGDSIQAATVTQSGFNNFLLVDQSDLNRASFIQKGTSNTLFYHQNSDSSKSKSSKINIKQKGNGNQATVIQN